MEKTLRNIKNVSLIFFILTGLIHLTSIIFIANEQFLKYAEIAQKTMDLPFILTGLLYCASSIRLSYTNPSTPHKVLDIFLISVIMIVLVPLLIVNLAIPNL